MAENRDLLAPEERAHAVLSASGSHRWVNCTGSVALSMRVDSLTKRGQTVFAAEGSAAHFVCEHCLEHGLDADDLLGMKVVPEGPLFDADAADDVIVAQSGQQYVFVIGEEMADAVNMYLGYIEQLVESCFYETKSFIEESGSLEDLWIDVEGAVAEHPWLAHMFGTSDFILEAFIDGILHIVDFKYGMGIAVDPDDNEQLMYYAAAYAGSALPLYDEVHLHIVQPRAFHGLGPCRVWQTTGLHIYEFFKTVVFPAAKECVEIHETMMNLEQDCMDGLIDVQVIDDYVAPYLNAGDACTWCDAITTCPKAHAKQIEIAQHDFMTDPVPKKVTEMPLPGTAEQFAKALPWIPIFKKWIKAVEDGANNFTLNGCEIEGFKRVAKRANRKWTSEEDAIKLCKKKRMKKAEYMVEKPLTPAQLEKILGPEAIEDIVIKESSGTTVAPNSDKRAAVRIDPAADFADADDEDDLFIPGSD